MKSKWNFFNLLKFNKNEPKKIKNIKVNPPNENKTGLPNESDIEDHKNKYNLCKSLSHGEKIILYGVSKGASTTFSSMCINKYSDIALVILESCLYSYHDLLKKEYGFFSEAIYLSINYFQPNLARENTSPGFLVEEFPENVPVAFIISKKDEMNYDSTIKLANKLKRKKKKSCLSIRT